MEDFHQINFRHKEALKTNKFAKDQQVDGVLMDLGISCYQIDEATRGFSFHTNGPLICECVKIRLRLFPQLQRR